MVFLLSFRFFGFFIHIDTPCLMVYFLVLVDLKFYSQIYTTPNGVFSLGFGALYTIEHHVKWCNFSFGFFAGVLYTVVHHV